MHGAAWTRWVLLLGLAPLALASGCPVSQQCPDGFTRHGDACAQVCNSNAECPTALPLCTDGVCQAGGGGSSGSVVASSSASAAGTSQDVSGGSSSSVGSGSGSTVGTSASPSGGTSNAATSAVSGGSTAGNSSSVGAPASSGSSVGATSQAASSSGVGSSSSGTTTTGPFLTGVQPTHVTVGSPNTLVTLVGTGLENVDEVEVDGLPFATETRAPMQVTFILPGSMLGTEKVLPINVTGVPVPILEFFVERTVVGLTGFVGSAYLANASENQLHVFNAGEAVTTVNFTAVRNGTGVAADQFTFNVTLDPQEFQVVNLQALAQLPKTSLDLMWSATQPVTAAVHVCCAATGGAHEGAHVSPPRLRPSTTWWSPLGQASLLTGLKVFNPGQVTANVDLLFRPQSGGSITNTIQLAPMARAEFTNPPTSPYWTGVTSDVPVMASQTSATSDTRVWLNHQLTPAMETTHYILGWHPAGYSATALVSRGGGSGAEVVTVAVLSQNGFLVVEAPSLGGNALFASTLGTAAGTPFLVRVESARPVTAAVQVAQMAGYDGCTIAPQVPLHDLILMGGTAETGIPTTYVLGNPGTVQATAALRVVDANGALYSWRTVNIPALDAVTVDTGQSDFPQGIPFEALVLVSGTRPLLGTVVRHFPAGDALSCMSAVTGD